MNLATLLIAICPTADAAPDQCKPERVYSAETQYRCEWHGIKEQNRLSREGKFYLPAQCQAEDRQRVAGVGK